MNRFLDAEKAVEAIVYISKKTTDLMHIVKILYFADKMHLEHYGRLITGDCYIAMEHGPVPSGAYDLIKYVRGEESYSFSQDIIDANPGAAFSVRGNSVTPCDGREVDFDLLSESDIECLDKAIELYGKMSIPELWQTVHAEESYNKTPRNQKIQLADIIMSMPDGSRILEYLDS